MLARINKFGTDPIFTRPRIAMRLLRILSLPMMALPCFAEDAILPSAETIIEKHIEAIGGRAAHEKIHNRVTRGTLSAAGMGSKARLVTYAEAPQNQYVLVESEAIGKIESGTDGNIAWELSTMMGPSLKEGEERAAILRNALFNKALHWKKAYKSAECVGVEEVDGNSCYKVVMTPDDGDADIVYYDTKTFYIPKTETRLKTQMGTLPLIVTFHDRKRVDGVLIPFKVVQDIVGIQKVELVSEHIEHNVKIPKDKFAVPGDVQDIVDAG